mmetsp:Transcript_28624/g.71977  ORF Transcript_28624/g.71977 Transcript_28624/m.71977 type:complete len:412 (+) Transcript_28624:280-1515(+)
MKPSFSSGNVLEEQPPQKMPPQLRQWCLRLMMLNEQPHAMQDRLSLSGTQPCVTVTSVWADPQHTCRMCLPNFTSNSRGMFTFSTADVPSCPSLPRPQENISPVAAHATMWNEPHAMCKICRPSTGLPTLSGLVYCDTAWPCPSCPYCPAPHVNTRPSAVRAAVCVTPVATVVIVLSMGTSVGTQRLSQLPRPSWPEEPSPHMYSSPDTVMPPVWWLVQHTLLTFCPGGICTRAGVVTALENSPTPNCPCALEPHINRSPLSVVAAEDEIPADTCTHAGSVWMGTGERRGVSSPWPRTPATLLPQDSTVPSSDKAIVWDFPQATCTTFTWLSDRTRVGTATSAVQSPLPRTPSMPHPHMNSRPFTLMAAELLGPHAIMRMSFPSSVWTIFGEGWSVSTDSPSCPLLAIPHA